MVGGGGRDLLRSEIEAPREHPATRGAIHFPHIHQPAARRLRAEDQQPRQDDPAPQGL